MKKIVKVFLVVIITAATSFVSLIFCLQVSKKYYFDKFYYQKSTAFGYIRDNQDTPLTIYGDRAKYITQFDLLNPEKSTVLGTSTDKKYQIIIIGDSYVWGMGLKNEDRYAYLLEKSLNKIRPTEVISIAEPGWNLAEYLIAYNQIKKSINPNLYIFGLVSNDSLINDNEYNKYQLEKCQLQNPDSKAVYALNTNTIPHISPKESDKIMEDLFNNSWSSKINLCLLDYNLSQLPTEKAIYFATDEFEPNSKLFAPYITHLLKNNKYIASSAVAKYIPKYKDVLKTLPSMSLQVSQAEKHPSALANQIFADVLYNEITSNPQLGFANAK